MSTVFYRGFVVDVINTVSGLTERRRPLSDYKSLVFTPAYAEIPRNSAVVKPISLGESKQSDREIVCYPFFSSHFCLPLKPGEEVWFVYENPDNKGSGVGYWMSRTSAPNHVEDTNFAFFKRTHGQSAKKKEKSLAEAFSNEEEPADDQSTIESPTNDAEEMAKTLEYAKATHRFEAVPRYNKRAGDLIIQGSNNTLIMLGEARGHFAPSSDVIKFSANDDDVVPNMGAIDIVVGRGARPVTAATEIQDSYLKVPENDKRVNRPTEGDADFKEDAARLYLVAGTQQQNKAHPDTLLSLSLPSTAGFTGFPASGKSNGSFAVLKADNLRLISRGSRKIPEANGFIGLFNKEDKDPGSILIIKEPSRNSSGAAELDGVAVVLHETGVLHLSGKEIRMMSYASGGAKEPYVKLSALESFLGSILLDITTFCTTLSTAAASLTASVSVPMGGPVVGAQAAGGTLTGAASTLLSAMTAKTSQLESKALGLGSTVIYGE
jgi:hypothetical protein